MNLLSLLSDNPDANISYYLVVAAYLQNFFSGIRMPLARLGLDNNVEPRETLAKLEKSGKVPPATLAKLKRRWAAHMNGFENLMMFAASVVAGNTAGLSAKYMNRVTTLYLLARIAFTYLYINGTTLRVSVLRSVAFSIAAGCYVWTFIKAGRALNAE